MQWGMRESAELQMAEVRERIRIRRRPATTRVPKHLDEEE